MTAPATNRSVQAPRASGAGPWFFSFYALLTALLGLALLYWGGRLAAVGGSLYYAGMGLALSLIHI